jgi:hypothetical protein
MILYYVLVVSCSYPVRLVLSLFAPPWFARSLVDCLALSPFVIIASYKLANAGRRAACGVAAQPELAHTWFMN